MNLKTTFSEGDVFSAGSTVDNDKLNGITNEVNRKGVIHRKVYSSAAEVTSTSGTYGDTDKTFDLSAPVNALITKIYYQTEIKVNGGTAYSGIKINGTNLGTVYGLGLQTNNLTGTNYRNAGKGFILSASEPSPSSGITNLISGDQTSYITCGNILMSDLKVLDETTTFTVRLANNGGGTSYIKNVLLIVEYVENFEEDA